MRRNVYTRSCAALVFAVAMGRSNALAQEPDPARVGPCTAAGWVRVSVAPNADGIPVHTFQNVGPYPIFLELASVVSSGNFAPRSFTRELTRLDRGGSRKLTERPGPGFAYRYSYFNAAYLDLGAGVFTLCADVQRDSVTMALLDLCREAHAADSCVQQAEREMAKRPSRRLPRESKLQRSRRQPAVSRALIRHARLGVDRRRNKNPPNTFQWEHTNRQPAADGPGDARPRCIDVD